MCVCLQQLYGSTVCIMKMPSTLVIATWIMATMIISGINCIQMYSFSDRSKYFVVILSSFQEKNKSKQYENNSFFRWNLPGDEGKNKPKTIVVPLHRQQFLTPAAQSRHQMSQWWLKMVIIICSALCKRQRTYTMVSPYALSARGSLLYG